MSDPGPTTNGEAVSAHDGLRLSMTLPGAASLGAYQAGAVSALSVMIRTLRSAGIPVHLDAIGGASAGSFVSMLFAHSLLTGRDTVALLAETWIDEVDITLLRSGGSQAPLAPDRLRERIERFLGDRDHFPYDVHEPLEEPVTVHVGLTSLRGFMAPIGSGGPESGLSYADWMEFELDPGHDHQVIVDDPDRSIVSAVLASATHPFGFRPRLIDRGPDQEGYEARGVTNFPESGKLWYTDGGLVESDPVGRIVEAARRRADASTSDGAQGRRVHLVVDPWTSGPTDDGFAEPDDHPSWMDGMRRSASIVPTQALHDDLRRLADVNERLDVLDDVVAEIADRLDATGQSEPADRTALRELLAPIGNLEGKVPVDVDVISPLVLADDDPGEALDLLAGDFIATFGGFLSARIRRSDFAVGWACATRWTEAGLPRLGLDDDVCATVAEAMADAKPDELDGAILDKSGREVIGTTGRWQLALLAAQYGRVLVGAALPRPGLPGLPSLPDLSRLSSLSTSVLGRSRRTQSDR